MDSDLALITDIAERRHGLVTARDLHRIGVTEGRRRGLRRAGILRPAARRVYRIAGAPRTVRQRVLESCLATGGTASHRTAAALHGLPGFVLDAPIEVLVPAGRRTARSAEARIHTTTSLPPDDLVEIDGIPTTGVARTLFLLAALVPEITPDTVRDAVDSAVASNLASDPWLWWRLEKLRCRGRNGVSVFETILVRRAGGEVTESWLERRTLQVLRDAGLPLPLCQRRIHCHGAFAARVDFLYAQEQVVIEVSGYTTHRSRAQTTADAARRRVLTLEGYRVHEFTYDEVVRTPEAIVQVVRAALGLPDDR